LLATESTNERACTDEFLLAIEDVFFEFLLFLPCLLVAGFQSSDFFVKCGEFVASAFQIHLQDGDFLLRFIVLLLLWSDDLQDFFVGAQRENPFA
jgi:hypothetical protein